jgi:hypothetical protein
VTQPTLGDHRLIGNGYAAALVRPDATVDWWCAPRFDSPPLLWSLLDPKGAVARFIGVEPIDGEPAAAGAAALTRLDTASGTIEVRDGLVDGRLFRLVRGLDGPLEITHTASLGGFDRPWLARDVETRLVAPAREWAGLSLGETGIERCPEPREVSRRLTESERSFRTTISLPRVPRHHPARAEQALAVLRACTYVPSGAAVASPTTSLPEAVGHDRQFDYRFTWLRDDSLAAGMAALLGRPDLAATHIAFLDRLGRRVDGGRVPEEREVPGIAGYAGSRPVRVGNAATEQLQYDALGFVVEAVSLYVQQGGALTAGLWSLVRLVADRCSERPEERTSGTWELRRPAPLVSADIGRWIALDRAIWLARVMRPWTRRRHWVAARADCRRRVESELRPDGRLPQSYGGDPDEPDATGLLIPIFQILDRDDERVHRLVDAHLAALGDGPWVHRYRPGGDDGFSGVEGAFVPCSWWAVSALASVGRVDEAAARADEMCARMPALLPEQVDPRTGASLGNTPLLWSHMELARALYLLEALEVRLSRGRFAFGLWRLRRARDGRSTRRR